MEKKLVKSSVSSVVSVAPLRVKAKLAIRKRAPEPEPKATSQPATAAAQLPVPAPTPAPERKQATQLPAPEPEPDTPIPAGTHEGMSDEFIRDFARVHPIPPRPPSGIMPEDHDLALRGWLQTLPETVQGMYSDGLLLALTDLWNSGVYFNSGEIDDVGLWVAAEVKAATGVIYFERAHPLSGSTSIGGRMFRFSWLDEDLRERAFASMRTELERLWPKHAKGNFDAGKLWHDAETSGLETIWREHQSRRRDRRPGNPNIVMYKEAL